MSKTVKVNYSLAYEWYDEKDDRVYVSELIFENKDQMFDWIIHNQGNIYGFKIIGIKPIFN